MVTASVSKSKMKKTAITIVIIALVAVAVIFIVTRSGGESEQPAQVDILGATTEEREAYLASLGIQVSAKSSVAQVEVPAEFDERFASYNDMLRTTGFDLEPLRGEVVTKCVYSITNRPDVPGTFSAILLVHDGKIVGGHLYSDYDSQIHPLFEAGEVEPSEPEITDTILPDQNIQQEPAPQQQPAEQQPVVDPPVIPETDEAAQGPLEETMYPID